MKHMTVFSLLAFQLMIVLLFAMVGPACQQEIAQGTRLMDSPALLKPEPLAAVPVKAHKSLVKGHKSLAKPKSTRATPKTSHAEAKSPFIRGHYVLTAALPVAPYKSHAPTVVIVDKGSHFTHVLQLQGNQVVRVYTMSNAVGKRATPSPPGRYVVVKKRKWPSWIPPKSIDPRQKAIHSYNKDRANPLGVAAIHLDRFGIVLHGTNRPHLIRRNASHGCVRHSNKDVSRLFGMVRKGTVVYIVNRLRGKVLHQRDFSARTK